MTDVLSKQKSELKTELKSELKILKVVLELIEDNPLITIPLLMKKSGKSRTTVQSAIKRLKEEGRLERVGSKRNGRWKVIN